MAAEQSDAIILRLVRFSETSLVVTAFTRELGQISALAKGAYRPKSPFDGSLDLLSVCRLVLISKPADTLDILTESKLQRRFRAGQWSLLRLHCGYYLAELLRHWTSERDRSEELFDLATETLAAVDSLRHRQTPAGTGLPALAAHAEMPPSAWTANDQRQDALWAVLRFEIRAMRCLGLMPSTRLCVACGTAIELPDWGEGRTQPQTTSSNRSNVRRSAVGRLPFVYDLGGVLCEACRPRHHGVAWLRPEVLQRLETLAGDAGGDALPGAANDNVTAGEISRVGNVIDPTLMYRDLRASVSRLVAATLGKVPRTQSLLPATWVSH